MALNAGTVQSFAELDISGFKSGMRKMKRQGDRASKDVESRFDRMGSRLASIGKVAFASIAASMVAVGGLAIKRAAEFETLRISMNALNGSVEEGARNFERLKEFSAGTPFQLQDLASAQNMLQGFGMAADDAFESMKMIGDIAAITGADINGIGIAFGQAAAEGRLMTRDIRQLINQGIPAIKLLADTMGVAQSEVLGLAEEGQISFEILQQAFRDATSAGGMFADGMKQQAESLSGGFSTLKDNTSILLGEIGELITESTDLEGIMRDVTAQVGKLTDSLSDANVPTSELRDTFRGFYVIFRELPGVLARVNDQFFTMNKRIQDIQTLGLTALGRKLGNLFTGYVEKIGKADRFTKQFGEEFKRFLNTNTSPLADIDDRLNSIVRSTKDLSKGSSELSFTNQQVLDSYNRLKPAMENIPPVAEIFDPSAVEEFNMSLNDIAAQGEKISGVGGRLKEIPEKLEEATPKARLFAHTLADGLQGVFFQAQNVQDAIKGIIRQLASRAFTAGIFSLFGVGGGFASNFFGGSFHTGGMVPGVGEKQISVKGGETVLTREQSKMLSSGGGGSQSVSVTVNVQGSLEGRGDTLRAVIDEQVRHSLRLRG